MKGFNRLSDFLSLYRDLDILCCNEAWLIGNMNNTPPALPNFNAVTLNAVTNLVERVAGSAYL